MYYCMIEKMKFYVSMYQKEVARKDFNKKWNRGYE